MRYNPNTDNAGQIPEVGDFVAYNYSGDIATGWIKRIGKSQGRYSGGRPIYEIHQNLPQEGHISKVRGGPKCVLVLEKKNG